MEVNIKFKLDTLDATTTTTRTHYFAHVGWLEGISDHTGRVDPLAPHQWHRRSEGEPWDEIPSIVYNLFQVGFPGEGRPAVGLEGLDTKSMK